MLFYLRSLWQSSSNPVIIKGEIFYAKQTSYSRPLRRNGLLNSSPVWLEHEMSVKAC